MTKAELDSKPLAELHALAADAEIPGYRMLARAELIEQLLEGGRGQKQERGGSRQGPARNRQRRPVRRDEPGGEERGRREQRPRRDESGRRPAGSRAEAPREGDAGGRDEEEPQRRGAEPAGEAAGRPRRRRRRWRRRGRRVRVSDLLLPAAPGRQAILHAATREGCTAVLRDIATELSSASKGPDPIALLIEPSPEELAEWRRDAPRAEIVAAGQARHADDALAQAVRRADAGEDVIVLIDSLSRYAESFGDADSAGDLFDAGRGAGAQGRGSLTVVAAVEQG